MHLAHFVHRYPPALGGTEAYVERLSRYFYRRGDRVTVWTSTAIDLEAMRYRGRETPAGVGREAGVTVRRYTPLRFPGRRSMLKAFSLVPARSWQALTLPCNPFCPGMWRDVDRYAGPVDAVHAFAFPYSFPAACGLRLARRFGVPFLLTPFLHLGDPTDPTDRTRRQYTTGPLAWLLRQADRILVQTPSERRAAVELGGLKRKVVLQGLGVDPTECTGGDRSAARRAWGVGPDEFVVGHLANLSAEKGSVDLLRTVGRLGPDVRVVLAGPDMPNFRKFWTAFAEQHRVIRLGPLGEEQKRDFFAGIDAFALPSRSDSFGLVLLEAWANAKPVLCYRAGGPADLVRDGEDGFVVPCGDVETLVNRLNFLAANPYRAAALGRTGRDRLTAFDWADRLAIVRDTLFEVVQPGRPVAIPSAA
jgi:glycosyltransferase involved in cell wall biosynthesis